MKNISLAILALTCIIVNLPIGQAGAQTQRQPGIKNITLEDIWQNNTFQQQGIDELRSMKDGLHYTVLEENDKGMPVIMKYEYKTGAKKEIMVSQKDLIPAGKSVPINIDSYQFNSDETKVLIAAETEHIYRHSTKENYYIWDRNLKKLTTLSKGGKQMLAEFSPDGTKVGFVRDNNLFVVFLDTKQELKITSDGKRLPAEQAGNSIINGTCDWVYEEEFSFNKAWFWSPDGYKIAYYRFDESNVNEFNLIKYGSLYPSDYRYKYPKAGEDNSVVEIHVVDIITNTNKIVDVGAEKDQYIPRIKWTSNPNVLCVERLNRLQNKLELISAEYKSKTEPMVSTVFFAETSSTYLEINDNLTFLSGNKGFLWTSEADGFNHIYHYDMTGKLVKQITKGRWDVTSFNGIDEATGTLYYVSAQVSPTQRALYAITIDGTEKKKLSEKDGTNTPEFSNEFKYFINTYSSANTPQYITLHSSDGKLIREIEKNKMLTEKMSEYRLTKKEFFKFKTSDGIELNGWMMKPPDFNETNLPAVGESHAQRQAGKYPVYMLVYGGPGINTVNDEWDGKDFMFHQMLAEKGYIVVSVDNRGTGNRGRDFRACTYKQLGTLETIDQIEAAKYLRDLPFVDSTRIGIQGWSYGGYMSALCITKGAEYFKMAIAVAPVTNWRYYDSIYTERYMGLPKDNAKGYDENAPINYVNNLKGKFLLIHGTADDNVHFQNSVELVNALVGANKQFSSFYYPDKNHGIYGGNTRLHLYTMMTNFIMENL